MNSSADSRIMGRLPIGGGSEVVAPVFLPSLRDGAGSIGGNDAAHNIRNESADWPCLVRVAVNGIVGDFLFVPFHSDDL